MSGNVSRDLQKPETDDNFDDLVDLTRSLVATEGISPVDIMQLPEPLADLFKALPRRGQVPAQMIADHLHLTPAQGGRIADLLVTRGYLTKIPAADGVAVTYKIQFGRSKKSSIQTRILDTLDF